MLLAWTAALSIYICAAVIVLVGTGLLAIRFTTGRTRRVLEIVLALFGLTLAILISL